MTKVLLVDGTNIVMRYSHAMLPDLMGKDARQPNPDEIERVCRSIEKALLECAEEAGCTHGVVALDSSVDPWRKAIYPDYKKGRTLATSSWSFRLRHYLQGRGWFCLSAPSFEADDILATLAMRLHKGERPCAILSGDSDLLALVEDGPIPIEVWQLGLRPEPRYVRRDETYVMQKYGVLPGLLRVWKALVGEPGDNLPGVKGIGEKKAMKFLDHARFDVSILRGLLPNHSGSAVNEFDTMLTVVTLDQNVPLDPISPAQCALPSGD